MKLKDFLNKCIDLLAKKSNTHILAGLGELIDENQKTWVKENLLKMAINNLKIKENTM